MKTKFSKKLLTALEQTTQEDDVEVIVELEPLQVSSVSSDRASRIKRLKDEFGKAAAPVGEVIRNLGGQVLEEAWLNQTLRARMPVGRIDNLSDADGVRMVDIPRSIRPE
jgi:hypothetical protein